MPTAISADRDGGTHNAEDPLLFIEEVADLTRIPVNTLRHRRRLNQEPLGFKVGRRVRYRRSRVLKWLQDLEAGNDVA
jgi:predicted DNA-binding transcriptional regulator AlpA